MAILISALSEVNRETRFTQVITVSGNGLPIPEIIESVTVTPIEKDSGITVSGTTISGAYTSTFIDKLTFVTKGSSDKIETPVTVIGMGNVPPNKELYKFIQDQRNSVDKMYTVKVVYNGGTVYTATIIQKVNNSSGAALGWLRNYIQVNK